MLVSIQPPSLICEAFSPEVLILPKLVARLLTLVSSCIDVRHLDYAAPGDEGHSRNAAFLRP